MMPKPEAIERALALISKRGSNCEYFFDHLESAAWIEPLYEHGMFQHPPPPKKEGEFISIPFWPESRYIARMAFTSPKQVLDIILKMPQTDNVRVHEDFIDAACNMPSELAAQWAMTEANWIESQQFLYLNYPEKIGSLIIYLAKNDQISIALDLARSLLEIMPDKKSEADIGKEERYGLSPTPRVRFDIWQYEQVLVVVFPALVKVSCFDAFILLSDLLDAFIRLSRGPEISKNYEDYSSIWRPAIEDNDQNLYNTLEDMLVSAVRDNAEQIGLIDADHLTRLIQILESKQWKVFTRIVLHLLRIYADRVPILVANHITHQSFFYDNSTWHEYALLLKASFKLMQPSQQEIILSWIEIGPDLGPSIELKGIKEDNKSHDLENEQYKKIWMRDHLALIKDDLPLDWMKLYENLVEDFGESSHPEFTSYSEGWIGPTSPKSSEELKSMTVDNVIKFLNSWSSPQEFHVPTPEGLGRVLSNAIANDPERFALEAVRFQGLDPTYVRALVSGLGEAIKKGCCVEWQPILTLCQWVISQPIEIPGRAINHRDADLDWEWTRKEVARLLHRGFEERKGKIPFGFRSICWALLSSLTNDPDPTPADEAIYGGSNMGPATLSINTTRGEAMHALIQYAFWVRQDIIKTKDEDYYNSSGFNEMPEVQEVLEYHLNPHNDPSPAVRSVYGQRFPWLVVLDKEWASKNAARIFPPQTNKESKDLYSAAWETYILFCDIYDNAFEILRENYSDAIEHLAHSIDDRKKYSIESDKRLVNHLVNYYWRGKLNLDDPQSMISRFYVNAPDSLRKYAIEYIGRSLYNAKDKINADILKRLQVLWLKRIDDLHIMNKRGTRPTEPIAFGWWFISGKFNDIWVTEQLKIAIEIAGKIEPDYSVLKQLSKIAAKMQLPAVECLKILVENENEIRSITLSRSDETRNILEIAINSNDVKAKKVAKGIIHYLGARGYFGYRDLIPKE
jgi:hypothetical protein